MAELTYRDAVARGIAQEMTRDPDVVFLGEDVGKAGGVFKATVGLYEQFGPLRVRDTPISEQAILGAAMGAAMTGSEADRRDHVLGFFRGVLRLHRQRICQEPLHVERPGQMPAGGAHRQRRRLAFRRAAFAERRELVHDDSRPQGGGAVEPARRDRTDGGGGARSRSGDLLRAQIALCDQGRSAGRRDRRHARHREDRAARQGRHHHGAGADGAARAGGGGKAQSRARHRLRSRSTCARWCRSTPRPFSARWRAPIACSPSRKIRGCAAGAPRSFRSSPTRRSTISTDRRCASPRRTSRCRPPIFWKTWRCRPPIALPSACEDH